MPIIEIIGEGVIYEWGDIDDDLLELLRSGNLDEDEISDIISDNTEHGLDLDGNFGVYIDGKKIDYDVKKLREIKPRSYNEKTGVSHRLVAQSLTKGTLYRFETDDEFEIEKLYFSVSRFSFGNDEVFFSIAYVSYDECIDLFDGSEITNYNLFLINRDGNYEEINKDDDETDNDEPLDTRRLTRIYTFKNKQAFENFIKWFETNLKLDIEEGLSDITLSEVEMEKNGTYKLSATGAYVNVLFMPTPTLEWAQNDIGSFKVKDIEDF